MSHEISKATIPFRCPCCQCQMPKYVFTFNSEKLGSEVAPLGVIEYVTVSCGGHLCKTCGYAGTVLQPGASIGTTMQCPECEGKAREGCGTILSVSVLHFEPSATLLAEARRRGLPV